MRREYIHRPYWLTNVALETVFIEEDGQIVGTKTETFDFRIEDAVVSEIKEAYSEMNSDLPTYLV